MPVIRGCHLPDDRLYDVANHIWFSEQSDGTVRLGMTAVAAAMAGPVVAVTPKKVGRSVEAGKSCATIESGKWVGPAKSAAAGEIAAVNPAVTAKPGLVNEDPYGEGWLVAIRPSDWSAVKPSLVSGADVAAPYEAKMQADGFKGCQ
jgi:glycine cleavage system H protein